MVGDLVGHRAQQEALCSSHALVAHDDQVRLYVHDGGAALPQLIRLLDEAGIVIRSISMSEPTLDDVFLRQTGRSLRDGGPEGARTEQTATELDQKEMAGR